MKDTNIPIEIMSDEVVRFISERYHSTPESVIESFVALSAQGPSRLKASVNLEDNEVRIIRDLINMYNQNA